MTHSLFKPFTFPSGNELQNHIFMAPITSQSALYDGRVSTEMVEFYRRRARNTGAIIIESTFVQDNGRGYPGAVGIDHDNKIPGLRRLAKAIQAEGAKAILQIFHAGRMAPPMYNQGQQPVAPSPVAPLQDMGDIPGKKTLTPRELTAEEVDEMIEAFGQATRRAIDAGFDGIEIHGANTFLIQQFYSPHSNRRMDRWGGSRDERAHFPLAVTRKVQEVVAEEASEDFIVGYRFSPEEIEEPGIRFEDTMYLLNKLAEEDLDYFHVSLAYYKATSLVDTTDTQPLIEKYRQAQSDRLAQIPLIGVGGIVHRADAEAALAAGYDAIAVGKAFIATPDWPKVIANSDDADWMIEPDQAEDLKIPETLWDDLSFMIRE